MEFKAENYKKALVKNELSEKTISKYLSDVKKYFDFCICENIDNDSFASIIRYKEYLKENYKSASVNSYLISLNRYFKWLEMNELRVSLIKCQRRYFTPTELTLDDYKAMLQFAQNSGKHKWYLIMRCLGSMGIRVGELKFITYEAVLSGNAEIFFKSKLRTILIPDRLQSELLSFCRSGGIQSGTVFMNKRKTAPLDTSVIWRNLKKIAMGAKIEKSKVYPHNFRHMFARIYMDEFHDIAELADILGHSSIETTRLYTKSSKETQRVRLDSLDL